MNKPLELKDGRIKVTRYRFNQIKKLESATEIIKIMEYLVKAQEEEISAHQYNNYMEKVSIFLLKPVKIKSNEAKIQKWISGLITKVNNYKEDHIFII
jgi:ABC-type xylose transport system substrate-binding protein